MMREKRPRCQVCHFLQTQCVCHLLPSSRSVDLRIIVLQDPKEAKHAKNTVSLLALALPQIECIAMDDVTLEARLQSLEFTQWRVVYPNEQANLIEQLEKEEIAIIKGIILIDATWRKAKRFYLTQPLLHSINSLMFACPPKEQYEIRKSPNDKALSTLEACCYAVEQLTTDTMQPIRDFMVASIEWQWRCQPKSHKHSSIIDR
ncbi:tRNA-uridine aminocarboxypropyltransferase [Marinomonas sp. TI.3.20]|uniref:tRNA-uridine aminocarboxypropyltransferase n=1 Tax=Marinomonas sp. TI.3.20 TaxID=3121296 RepID=UPI00311E85EC